MDQTVSAERKAGSTSPLKAPRKRKRIVISCTECHRRKQKCDRAAPCSNCVARNKHSLCHYENESARKQQLLEESRDQMEGGSYSVIKPGESDSEAQVSAFGYAKSNGNNNTTLGIFKKIENYGTGENPFLTQPPLNSVEFNGQREKYKNLIRQLPSKQYIEKLIATFFKDVNFQYYAIDEGIFRDLLTDWHNLSFATLNKGPAELPPDLQFFPALLFQTLALALQFQPPDYDPSLETLKYAAGMSFDDLASDYSESGCQILCLLGKRHTTLVTVQAGFLRTGYLKNCGLVPESWHFLSQTIRDAQEIGLHKDTPYRPARRQPGSPEDVLENLWIDQLRRRMWLILSLWDIHMALTLGRPTTIDSRDPRPAFPIDAPVPKNRREIAPSPRTDSDHPTPLTALLWTAELGAPLWDIFNLEREDPQQNNIQKVERMHLLIAKITLHCPSFFRAENPDTRFDSHPDCYWIHCSRKQFSSAVAFALMCLHRPYIFTNPSSRTCALKAGLDVLRAQREYFELLSVRHYKMFSLVLNTFDAVVLVSAIFILHPCENVLDLDDALQHFEWAMERFHTMADRNSMATAALNVLKAIHVRLKRVLSQAKCPLPQKAESTDSPLMSTPESTRNQQVQTASPLTQPSSSNTPTADASLNGSQSNNNNNNNNNNAAYILPTISNMTEGNMDGNGCSNLPAASQSGPSEWDPSFGVPLPTLRNRYTNMAPLQPTHDLLYNDLGTVGNFDDGNGGIDPSLGGSGLEQWKWNNNGNGLGDAAQWQFEGDFGNDSFWGFMNNYNPV